MSFYPAPWSREDQDYEMNAREDYMRELQAEHFDHWADCDPADNGDESADAEAELYDDDIPF